MGHFDRHLLGGFLAGALAAALLGTGEREEPLRLFLGMGVLGGFTTFSAFSMETADMLQRGQLALAAGYALSSVIGAVTMLFLGLWLTRAAA
jgi:CrcB protein